MTQVTRRVLLAAVVLVLAGCSPSPPPVDPESPAAAYVRTGEWGEGDSGLLEGTLRLQNGCLAVESEDGWRVPVFPTDLEWHEDELALRGLGEEVLVDEPVSLGGGGQSLTPDHLPEACGGAELFIVHSIGDARSS